MHTPSSSPELSILLHDVTWIRGLAHRLVRDAAEADDVIQEAWLSALSHPPRHDRSLRGWWTVVMRNVVRQRVRSEGTRASHERRAARSERVADSPADVVERAETLEGLVQAVLQLEEPYRRVLLWRYFDEREPSEIARLLGIPAGTVRSQLKRGLDLLRSRLDGDRSGERRGWALALVPLALPAPGAGMVATAAIGGLLVSMTAKCTLAALAVGLLLFGTWSALDELGAPEGREEEGPNLLRASLQAPPDPEDAPATLGANPTLTDSGTRIGPPKTHIVQTGPTALLGGLIVPPAGMQAGGVTLEVQSPPGRGGWQKLPVEADGTFEWKRESAAPCHLCAVGMWQGRQWRVSRIVQPDEAWVRLTLIDIRILMKPVPGVIQGRVSTPPREGEPWLVVWRRWSPWGVGAAEVAADGTFRLPVPNRRSQYALFVRKRNAFWPRRDSVADLSPVWGYAKDVELKRGTPASMVFRLVGQPADLDTISAHFVDFAHGTPGKRVTLRIVDGRASIEGMSASRSKHGIYFGPTADGHAAWWVGRGPEDTSEIRVELKRQGSVAGRVSLPPGVKLREPVRLQVVGLGEVLLSADMDEDLGFEVKGVMHDVIWWLQARAVASDGRVLRNAPIHARSGNRGVEVVLDFVAR